MGHIDITVLNRTIKCILPFGKNTGSDVYLISDQSGITQYRKTHDNIGRAFHPTECINRRSGGYFLSLAVEKQHLIQLDGNFFIKLWKSFQKTFTHNTASLHVRLCIFCLVFLFVCFSCVFGYRLVTCFILLLLCHFIFYLFFFFLFKKPHLDLFIIITTYK